MSALIDIWTAESAKLRAKVVSSGGAISSGAESKNDAGAEESTSFRLPNLSAILRFKNGPKVLYSETAMSMILEYASP
ncbi:hypothetical protein GIB67_025125 [Kingdonia uniflora]|uniref:Uncharacterized protein n=1 Tax=Kingdonia uniflora TaxID=39325 RepID=A0A7J7N7Q3_9MAGN|nr:hypothetical protein GIB67_025125 [Kingdonia uniflora]